MAQLIISSYAILEGNDSRVSRKCEFLFHFNEMMFANMTAKNDVTLVCRSFIHILYTQIKNDIFSN